MVEAVTDYELEEFVVGDDDYPEVTTSRPRVAAPVSDPDRVEDIDDWLEEFAVSDCLDALPR